MKPGVMRKAPPKTMSTPSITSLCGTRPSARTVLKRPQTALPWERSRRLPRIESTTSSATVPYHFSHGPTTSRIT